MGPWRGKSPHQQPGELQRCTDCKARLETERVHQNSPQGYVGAPREDRLQAKQSWGLPYPSAQVLTLSRAHTVSPTIKVAEGKIGTNISGGEDRQLGACKSTPLIIPVPPGNHTPGSLWLKCALKKALGWKGERGLHPGHSWVGLQTWGARLAPSAKSRPGRSSLSWFWDPWEGRANATTRLGSLGPVGVQIDSPKGRESLHRADRGSIPGPC